MLSLSVSLSALGQEPWILGFLDNGVNLGQIRSAAILADGSAVILLLPPPPSLTESEPYLLVCFDAHGNRRWARQLPHPSLVESEATGLLALQDGTFLLFLHAEGTIPPDCGMNVWGSRWTPEGEVLWQRYFMLYDIYWSLEAFQVPSGRVFLTSDGGELQELDVETGEALWEKVFWVVPPDGWAQGLGMLDVVERADGGSRFGPGSGGSTARGTPGGRCSSSGPTEAFRATVTSTRSGRGMSWSVTCRWPPTEGTMPPE